MDCIKCKKGIPEDALFCPYCGKKQMQEKKKRKRANGQGMAVQAGVKPEILQKILGHADDSTTVDIYTHMDLAEILEGGSQVTVTAQLQQVKK